MKTIKDTRRLIAIFLTCTLLFPSITSCVEETNEILDDNHNQAAFAELKNRINVINNASPDIEEILHDSQISNRNNEYGITQELIDDFATEYGFEQGAITLDFVEAIIEQKAVIDETGFEDYTYNVS